MVQDKFNGEIGYVVVMNDTETNEVDKLMPNYDILFRVSEATPKDYEHVTYEVYEDGIWDGWSYSDKKEIYSLPTIAFLDRLLDNGIHYIDLTQQGKDVVVVRRKGL